MEEKDDNGDKEYPTPGTVAQVVTLMNNHNNG